VQVEFYFSDSNIPRDQFLLDQVKKHPDGCEFQRQRLLPPLCNCTTAAAAAVTPPQQ
jgi:hypothetical protein